ncbi:MAG TPA: glycerate kinase [Angustibacter sp.]|nr:glycerate kinase [Angustibacter sp.]
MRVLLAPDAFGPLTATQAADAIAAGWREQAPGDTLATCPQSDGGAGFVDVVLAARGGELLPVTVSGPLGAPVPATVLVCPASGAEQGQHGEPETAYVEAAQACGLHLLGPDLRDPWRATSRGLGELLLAAIATGAQRIVVGVADTASHDAGAGLLAALGVGEGRLDGGGGSLSTVAPDDLVGLPAARDRLREVELVVAPATDIPLLGFHGASAVEAAGRGAGAEQAQALEASLGHFAQLAEGALVAGRPLAGTAIAARPGAGAGGGAAFALMLLGARWVDGVQAAAEATRLADRVRGSDLVVTGEELFGWESTRAGVVKHLAAVALEVGVPSVVIAQHVEVGRRETSNLGLSGAYAVVEGPPGGAPPADPAGALAARARRVARTWSH